MTAWQRTGLKIWMVMAVVYIVSELAKIQLSNQNLFPFYFTLPFMFMGLVFIALVKISKTEHKEDVMVNENK